jgi:hypothetical protein
MTISKQHVPSAWRIFALPAMTLPVIAVASAGAKATLPHSACHALGRVVAGLHAAIRLHDARAFRAFRDQLVRDVGVATVDRSDADYRRVLTDLGAAIGARDPRLSAHYLAQFEELCRPTDLSSAMRDLTTAGVDLTERTGTQMRATFRI